MTKMSRNKIVEYMCTYCGQKQHRPKSMGRPMPSRCPKCGNMVTTSCTTTCTCHKCKTVMHIDSYGKIRRVDKSK